MDKLTVDVLGWVNEFRKERNMEPLHDLPLGIPGTMLDCPLSNATGVLVGPRNMYARSAEPNESIIRETPSILRSWMRQFDGGSNYKEYRKRPWV